MTKEEEIASLQDRAKLLKQEYDSIRVQLKELQKEE